MTVWPPDSAMFWNARATCSLAIWCGRIRVSTASPNRTSPSLAL